MFDMLEPPERQDAIFRAELRKSVNPRGRHDDFTDEELNEQFEEPDDGDS